MSRPSSAHLRRAVVAGVAALSMAAVPLSAWGGTTDGTSAGGDLADADGLTTVPSVADPDVGRQAVPEDQYAMALGCYELTNVASGQPLALRDGSYGDGETATPLHFEPTRLEHYLLLDTGGTHVAAAKGAAEQAEDGVGDVEYVAPVDRDLDGASTLESRAPSTPLPTDEVPGVDTHTGAVVPGEAGPSADWRARHNTDGTMSFLLPAAAGRALAVIGGTAVLADAGTAGDTAKFDLRAVGESTCAAFPDVEVNVDGPVLAGDTPWDETRGTIDAHLHLMAFEFLGGEFRCGRPWHPYGVTEALGDCYQNEFAGGRLAEGVFGDGPDNFGDDVFWPEFTVPTPRSKTYEQVYHRWLERAWRGGLRMMTVLLVENNVLCEQWPDKRNSCDEMESVRLQAQRLRELVDYLDARAGGPGEGFAQIAETPFEAREIVNSGRLAFVVGMETSVPFGCREYLGTSECTNADIVEQLDVLQDLGVSQLQIVNKFDNALTGVKGDSGLAGPVVNSGNRYDTGHYWPMVTCPEDRDHGTDLTQPNVVDEGTGTPAEPVVRDPLAAEILTAVGMSGAAPVYPAGPHCNSIGLTDQGRFAIEEIAKRGMIFDPDHMSAIAAKASLDVIEELDYSGVISSHGWADDLIYERIYSLGGTVTPYAGGSEGFVGQWRKHLNWVDDRYYFGFGYGADTNGLGGQGTPRNPDETNDVDYPFEAPGGALVDKQVSGTRTPYDVNTDGVAHYGLYADWIEDLRVQAGDAIVQDMLRGPEAYLQVWERAVGIAKDACVFGSDGDPTAGVTRGMTFAEVLRTAGQPAHRDDQGYLYCGVGPKGQDTHVLVEFDEASGTVAGVTERPAQAAAVPARNPARAEAAALAPAGIRTDVVHDHGDGHDHGAERVAAHDGDHAEDEDSAGDVAVTAAGTPASAPTGRSAPGSGLLLVLGLVLLGIGVTSRSTRST